MIPHSYDSGSELLNMWSSNVADVWIIRVGSVVCGWSECVNRVFKNFLDQALRLGQTRGPSATAMTD